MSSTIRTLALVVLGLGSVVAEAHSAQPVFKFERRIFIFENNTTNNLNSIEQDVMEGLDFTLLDQPPLLAANYQSASWMGGSFATRAKFTDKLKETVNKPNTKAVDLVFVVHGLGNLIVFKDQVVSMTTLRNDILNKLTANERAKLRCVYSTASFGSQHNAKWIEAGFKVAIGSKTVQVDCDAAYDAFIAAWKSGDTALVAKNEANVAGAPVEAAIESGPLGFVLDLLGFSIASARTATGATSLTISTMP